jgi:hypothetical protein
MNDLAICTKPVKSPRQLPAALTVFSPSKLQRELAPRACLGLFATTESLGFGFVQGVQ